LIEVQMGWLLITSLDCPLEMIVGQVLKQAWDLSNGFDV
jgi:hypothetical protein